MRIDPELQYVDEALQKSLVRGSNNHAYIGIGGKRLVVYLDGQPPAIYEITRIA